MKQKLLNFFVIIALLSAGAYLYTASHPAEPEPV